jgi:hypothetical protein
MVLADNLMPSIARAFPRVIAKISKPAANITMNQLMISIGLFLFRSNINACLLQQPSSTFAFIPLSAIIHRMHLPDRCNYLFLRMSFLMDLHRHLSAMV